MGIIRLANHSPVPFTGWKRATVDWELPHPAYETQDCRVIAADRIAPNLRKVDIHVSKLLPGETRTIDSAGAREIDWRTGYIPTDVIAHFGGPILCDGEIMSFASVGIDGAAYCAHLRHRTGKAFHVDLYVRYYPDQPSHAHAEAIVTCSNPLVPDIEETTDKGITITFGRAVTVLPGPAYGAVIPPGTRFVDGQAMAVPILFVWLDHVTEWGAVIGDAVMGVGAVGIERLLPDGNPHPGSPARARQWATNLFPRAIERVRNWGPGVCGPVPNSGQTGDQEDQMFVRGEPLEFPGAEWVAYLTALKSAHRPCHFLESDGTPVDPQNHPQLVYWSGRPHWHHGVSPDRLGKPLNIPDVAEPSGGWLGPDRQHWLLNTLTAAARYTGSPALQQLLTHQAMLFLGQETVAAGYVTSDTDVPRSVGYAGLLVSHLTENLADRDLVDRVQARWRRRVFEVYLPNLDRGHGIWHPMEDARITQDMTGYTHGVLGWQQAFGVYGLALGCRATGIATGEQFALRCAKACIDYHYTYENGRWVEWDNVGWIDGTPLPQSEMVEGRGAHRTGWFALAWFPCAVATVLYYEPQDTRARSIWQQMLADSDGGDSSWMPPGISL